MHAKKLDECTSFRHSVPCQSDSAECKSPERQQILDDSFPRTSLFDHLDGIHWDTCNQMNRIPSVEDRTFCFLRCSVFVWIKRFQQMIQWDLFFVTCLVIGIVIWAILYLRHSNATSRPFSIPPAPYFAGDPQSPLWETLMLPQAGTLRGTNIPVNLASNILVFRSQMKTRTGSEFRFPVAQFISNPPAPIPLDVQLQKLYDSQKRGQMLYD